MALIVTGILSKSVGLLLNKARDKAADKLKDGDITDAKIREIIVRELNDVKTKLDGLSRKDLNSSYSFLQEGVNLLKASLDKSEEKQKSVLNETRGDGGETSTKQSNAEPGILTEALTLSQAMGRVKINSDREFESAKERFKDARKEATKAYGIETLRIEDRIFAAKLRIVSELLECLESPDTAIINCLPFLEKLHSLPAIREIFSVYINGGYKSILKKAERVENVKSVMLINYVLFRYTLEFGSKYYSAITWPTIELGDRSFRPILDWQDVSTRRSWGDEFIQPPNQVILDKERNSFASAVNSHGEIIFRASDEKINVTSRTGEVKMTMVKEMENYPGNGEVIKRYITGLAIDSNNNVNVLMCLETRTERGAVTNYVLCIFDENNDVKQNCTLHFLDEKLIMYAEIAIDKNNDIIISIEDDFLYVCDNAGLLKHKFKPDESDLCTLAISDKNEIFLATIIGKTVHKYTEKGDLEWTIEVPERHVVFSAAFHHVICKIMVVTLLIEKSDSYFLLCYSKTGELENSTFLFKSDKREYPVIRSHPSGPAAVISSRSVTFI